MEQKAIDNQLKRDSAVIGKEQKKKSTTKVN